MSPIAANHLYHCPLEPGVWPEEDYDPQTVDFTLIFPSIFFFQFFPFWSFPSRRQLVFLRRGRERGVGGRGSWPCHGGGSTPHLASRRLARVVTAEFTGDGGESGRLLPLLRVAGSDDKEVGK